MNKGTTVRPLSWRTLCSLLLAMFTIAAGFGVVLPILPATIARVAGTTDTVALSRHTGILTGTYTLAVFMFAPLWGRVADRYGRQPIILMGVFGFSITLVIFAFAETLPLLYLGRFLNGLFASSIAPAAYALVGDHAPTKEWRAHRFALLNMSGAAGFLVGPMLGGLAVLGTRTLFPSLGEPMTYRSPFLAGSGFAFLVALAIWAFVPNPTSKEADAGGPPSTLNNNTALPRLLNISFVTAAAVGAFEVGLALRATQILNMSPYEVGLMFTECSLVMLVAQAIVFSPLVKPETTRWFLTPALAVLAVGLAGLPLATATVTTIIFVGMIAGSAGILSPIVTYWISLSAGERQGAELGRQTAAASLGQATGSAAGGLLFGVVFVPNAPFTLTAVVVLSGLVASIGLPRLLAPPRKASA